MVWSSRFSKPAESEKKNPKDDQQATAPTKSIAPEQELPELRASQVAAQTQFDKCIG
jgi:hypothetical protein